MIEIQIKLNQIAYDARSNVTSTALRLNSIFTAMNSLSGIKSTYLHNFSDNDIYFGQANSVTISTAGGVIKSGTSIEIPIEDRNSYPFFISGPDSSIGIVVFA